MEDLAKEQKADLEQANVIQLQKEQKRKDMYWCQQNEKGPHHFIPTSWSKSERSEHVTGMLCTLCFKKISMDDVYNVSHS